jgi:hypothetical protein
MLINTPTPMANAVENPLYLNQHTHIRDYPVAYYLVFCIIKVKQFQIGNLSNVIMPLCVLFVC